MSDDTLEIDDLTISKEEATETLRAIRAGQVDAVVVNSPNGQTVLTFRDPHLAYRALVEAMGEGAALVTHDGIVRYHNPRFAELTTRPTPLRGRALRDLVAADATASIDALLARARLGPARIEVDLITRDGGSSPVQLTASVAAVADVPVICIVATDLREQRAQAELYREALVGIQTRERLLSIAGHELRAPLQALVFDLGVLQARHAGSPDLATVERLDAIHQQALQIASLVGSLLDVGLVLSNQLELTIEEVDLAELVRSVAQRSDELARSGSSITFEIAPVHGEWDRRRLEQVVANLISNAAKYGLGKPIRVALGGDDQLARLIIEDHGVGIAPDAVGRLFRPFERIGTVKTATGLGLGLYITAQVVNAHGGVIRVESDPNVGSRFVVELPRRRA